MNRLDKTTKRLGKIALAGLLVFPWCAYATRWLIQEKIKQSESHTEMVEYVRNHDGVKALIGDPCIIGRIEIGIDDTIGKVDNKKWFTVPISGPKAHGDLTYWVTITDPSSNEFHLSKIEMKAQDRDGPKKKWSLLLKEDTNTVKSIGK